MVKEYEFGELIVAFFLYIREDHARIRLATVGINMLRYKMPFFYTCDKSAEYRPYVITEIKGR